MQMVQTITADEAKTFFPGAVEKFTGALLERTLFTMDDENLYAETLHGSLYTWSPEDKEWYGS